MRHPLSVFRKRWFGWKKYSNKYRAGLFAAMTIEKKRLLWI